MADLGRVLIADDEETFLYSTAELVRQHGYHCDCAVDAETAADMLKAGEYDTLVADIKMPGNPNLELVQSVPTLAKGLPVILVTAYPSLRSAVQSIQLPVVAYMVKPIEIDDLLGKIRSGVQRSRTFRAVNKGQERLADWRRELEGIEAAMDAGPDASGVSGVPLNTFLTLTLRNIVGCLADLKQLVEALTTSAAEGDACHLLNCPRPLALNAALAETIAVLEKTKSAFKSKDLGELRKKLERLVKTPPIS